MVGRRKTLEIEKRFVFSYGIYIVFAVLVIVYAISSHAFLSLSNIRDIFMNSSDLLIYVAGLTFVVLTGNIDVSFGSTAFASVAIGIVLLVNHGVSPVLAILVTIAFGMVVGAVNGVLVAYVGIDPLVTTLGMLFFLRGLALNIIKGSQIELPNSVAGVTTASFAGVPLIVMVAVVILVVLQLLLRKTQFGRHVIAVGCDRRGAQQVGIRVRRITFITFVLSGTCAGVGGILAVINIGSVQSAMGQNALFAGVAALVVGGTSLFGGLGSVLPGALVGSLLLSATQNGLSVLGVSPYVYPFVEGLVIIVAMYMDGLKNLRIRGSRSDEFISTQSFATKTLEKE